MSPPPPSALPTMTSAPPPTTYGWDVVVACRTSRINAGLTPVSQPFDESVAHPTGAVHAVGSFDGCAVAAGGSGALINLSFACPTLTLSNPQKTFKFTDGNFLVQSKLVLHASAPGSGHELKIATGHGAVTVLAATFPQAEFVTLESYAKAAVQQWFDLQTDLSYVFATVGSPTGGFSAAAVGLSTALEPVATTYAYADSSDGDGVLGLMGVVQGGADPAELLAEVDPGLVAEHPSVLVINATVLQQLVGGLTTTVGLTGSTASIHLTTPMSLPWDSNGAST